MNDREMGYYMGLAYYAKVIQEQVEELQEHGLSPYIIIDALLGKNAEVHTQAVQFLNVIEKSVKSNDKNSNSA